MKHWIICLICAVCLGWVAVLLIGANQFTGYLLTALCALFAFEAVKGTI